MRLEQLHYFETLIQTGSYTKAAKQLHISQPSLTASIKAIEKELDKQLLIRNTRNIALTEEGKQVLLFAKETLASYQALLQSLSPEEKLVTGNLSIMASKFFCELILEHFLQSLRSKYPEFKVRLIENEYHATPQNLDVIGCKFAILTRMQAKQEEKCEPEMLVSDEIFFDSRYQYLPLFTDTFGFCAAKSSLLSSMPVIYPDNIDSAQYPATTFPFGEITVTEELYLASNNPKLHIDAMLNENAFCNIPYFVYQHIFAQEEQLTFRAYSNNMTITYYLVYPAEHTLTTSEQIFIDELQNYLTQMELK